MPFVILLLFGLALLVFWISIPVAIYLVPVLVQQWSAAGVALSTLEQLVVYYSRMMSRYWWLLLPLLIIGTAFWAYLFYRTALSPEDLPDR